VVRKIPFLYAFFPHDLITGFCGPRSHGFKYAGFFRLSMRLTAFLNHLLRLRLTLFLTFKRNKRFLSRLAFFKPEPDSTPMVRLLIFFRIALRNARRAFTFFK